jgi:hypothetical protein
MYGIDTYGGTIEKAVGVPHALGRVPVVSVDPAAVIAGVTLDVVIDAVDVVYVVDT